MLRKLFILLFLCVPGLQWGVSAQPLCDTSRIREMIQLSGDLLDQYENEASLDTAIKAWNAVFPCKSLAPELCREVYLQTDQSYRALASVLIQRGLFNRAIDLAERDIALHMEVQDPLASAEANAYVLLGNAHNLNGNQHLAIEALRKGLEVRRRANPLDPRISMHYDQLSNSFLALNDTIGVHTILLEWEGFYRKIGKKGGAQLPLGLATQWSMYYEMTGQPELGANILEDTLAAYQEIFKQKATFLGIAEFQLCELYAQMRDFRKSLFYSEKNIKALEARMQQQNGQLFTRSHYTWHLAQSARSAWNLYIETRDTTFWSLAVQRTEAAEMELRAMRDRAPDDGFRDWIANRVGIVANLMEVRYGLYRQTGNVHHAERSFESVEASKMFAVQEYLHETYALQWGGIPDSLFEKEAAFRAEINGLEDEFLLLKGKPGTDSLLVANEKMRFAKRDLYRRFLQGLEQQYPYYFQLKYRHNAILLPEVQSRLLRPEECMLDLSLENNRVFLLLVRPDTVVWWSALLTDTLEQSLELVEEGSRQYPDWQSLPEEQFLKKTGAYTTASFQVYQALIAPVRSLLKERVLLVPRDRLAGFPFGALLTQPDAHPVKPFLWHFLDQELVLSEIYSAGLFQFLQMRNLNLHSSGTVLAMAPFHQAPLVSQTDLPAGEMSAVTRARVFSALPATGAEARNIARIGNGKALLGQEATVKNFQELCHQYQVLHLATHSVADEKLGEYSFVALQTDQNPDHVDLLFARDIYRLRLSAELVVLSACETALGQFRENEGIVGLTRAFQCAGARNVAASLWEVNDASTSALMVLFYEEIQKGQPYHVALAYAKRRFIQSNRQQAHPYYWAGFVLQGR